MQDYIVEALYVVGWWQYFSDKSIETIAIGDWGTEFTTNEFVLGRRQRKVSGTLVYSFIETLIMFFIEKVCKDYYLMKEGRETEATTALIRYASPSSHRCYEWAGINRRTQKGRGTRRCEEGCCGEHDHLHESHLPGSPPPPAPASHGCNVPPYPVPVLCMCSGHPTAHLVINTSHHSVFPLPSMRCAVTPLKTPLQWAVLSGQAKSSFSTAMSHASATRDWLYYM